MFFKYEPGVLVEERPPRPVYARVDQIEPVDDADDAPSLVLLDCIDAHWLDNNADLANHLSDPRFEEADRWISIIAISSDRLAGDSKGSGELAEWYRLELGEPDGGAVVEQFYNLFQDPTERGVIGVRRVNRDEEEMLNELAGWRGVEETPRSDIENLLSRVKPVDAVAIYDVGQGAATALLSCGVPTLYFDLGGSAIGNWRSFPGPLQQFCMTYDPPIVLSHWDWDHWSSALRDLRALKRPWILPIQDGAGDLGAVHARFLAMLKANRANIRWWHHGTTPITSPRTGVTLFQAQGPRNSRNESGLALSIKRRDCEVLLPGDASLRHVCPGASGPDYLMVPHHGGRTNLGTIPSPNDRRRSHLVYSYGIGNSYLHPFPRTVRALRRIWKKNTHTGLRDSSGLGHVGIDFLARSKLSNLPPCGNCMCQLGIRQWL